MRCCAGLDLMGGFDTMKRIKKMMEEREKRDKEIDWRSKFEISLLFVM